MTSRNKTFSRRHLLAGVVALAAPSVGAASSPGSPHASTSPEKQGRALLTSLGLANRAARDQARALLADMPQQRDNLAASVRDAATAVGMPAERIPSTDPDVLRQRCTKSVRADFSAGRTIHVGGWVLSRTEFCLYRVAALL